jgi:hypothetical protein
MVLNSEVVYFTIIAPAKGTRNVGDTDFEAVIVEKLGGGNYIDQSEIIDVKIVHTSKKDNGDIHYTVGVFGAISSVDRKAKYTVIPLVVDLTTDLARTAESEVGTGVGARTFLQLRSKNFKEAIYDMIAIEYST